MAKKKHFIKKPVYEGGPKAMKAFIAQNLRYPPEARAEGVEGTVVVRFDIDHSGKVARTKVVTGIGYGCDEEAERLVRLLVFRVPRTRKLRVLFHKTINIHFRLPAARPTPPSPAYVYTVVPAKDENKKPSEGGYSYTIDLNG